MKAAGIAIALFTSAALAQQATPAPGATTAPEDGRKGSVVLMLGGYKPEVDSTAGLSGSPYSDVLHGPMLLFQLEGERFLWQKYGAAGFGFSFGYGEKYGPAKVTTGTGTTDEKTALKVLPLRLVGVYRFDYAALHWHVPLVPYGKLGLAYTAWWAIKGSGVEDFQGKRGAGGKWGWTATGGVALMLDFLEPTLAREFRTDIGVRHTYAFAELAHDSVNNFGGDGLDLSADHWSFGLAFDF